MAIREKMLAGIVNVKNEIKSWCNNRFALTDHSHVEFLNQQYAIKTMNFDANGYWIIMNNGFCVQGGVCSFYLSDLANDLSGNSRMHKTFADLGYIIHVTLKDTRGGAGSISARPNTVNQFGWHYDHSGRDSVSRGTGLFYWEAKGFLARGQY